jgi:hypothetical protein
MTNLIQQTTTSATDAQPAGKPHQRSSQEAFVKGLARLLKTTEAATYVGLSPRTVEKHRTYGTGPVSLRNPFVRTDSGHALQRRRQPWREGDDCSTRREGTEENQQPA